LTLACPFDRAEIPMTAYSFSIVGVLFLCLLSIVLADHSGSSKGRAGALYGPVLPPDDDNLLYRVDRVHMNAVEALTPFAVPAVLGTMVGVSPTLLATLVWVYVAIRVIHVAVYLRGGKAAKGGSFRAVLYVAGALVTVVLIVTLALATIR